MEQCSTQAHTTAAQILPDRLTILPGVVELVALQSPTLFFSLSIGKPLRNFSALWIFVMKVYKEIELHKAIRSTTVACRQALCHCETAMHPRESRHASV
jgi:hypothetical protein